MKKLTWKYLEKDDGAVTVDWVILTAAVVSIAVVAYIEITAETINLSERSADSITAYANR